jgi:F0F1-type ATP synthase membrane subunit b/b'
MEREQIVREDFPTVRKGWDPEAVRAHLKLIADSVSGSRAEASLGDVAADQVKSVLAAAEAAASEITSSARAEASEIVASARAEASELLDRAKADAGTRTTAAQDAAQAIVDEAERLRSQVAELARRVAGSSPAADEAASPAAEVPGPVVVPEPTPPTIPEPTPDPVPEPTPEPSPDPLPDPVPEPTPDPVPDEPAAANGVSTEDLIAQLKAGTAEGDAQNGSSAPAVAATDLGAARLVAMNMALDGADRDAIAAQLRSDFGEVPDLDGLLDEVISRAKR